MGNVFGTRNSRDFQIAMDEMGSVEETSISASWKVIKKEESEFEIVLEKVIRATVDDAKNRKESEFHAFTTAMLEYEKKRLSIEKQRWADTNQWSELERERLDIEKKRLNSQLAHQRKVEENQNEKESQQRTIENLSRTVVSQQEANSQLVQTNARLVKELIEIRKKINSCEDDRDGDGNDENDEDDDDEGDDAVES